jgi:hypothetical protein
MVNIGCCNGVFGSHFEIELECSTTFVFFKRYLILLSGINKNDV